MPPKRLLTKNVNPNNEKTTLRLPATSNQLQDLQSKQYAYQQNSAKYQHRVLLQINIKSGVLRVQSNRPKTDPFSQCFSGSSESLSDYEDELLEDESSEDEIFSHLTKTCKNLVLQALHAICSSLPFRSNQPLKKYIDILDYDTLKNYQLEVNSLETFIAKSFKIHVEFLKAESRRENSNYNSIVLNHIKELDRITI
ncbi:13133_t:CDS:2, partial [Gigaspora margarita]